MAVTVFNRCSINSTRLGLGLVLIYAVFTVTAAAQVSPADPTPKPVAIKFLEIGKSTDRSFLRTIEARWPVYDQWASYYIINYGTDREIARRERLITSSKFLQGVKHWGPRITLVRGGLTMTGPKTLFWKVPPGANNPLP